MTISENELLGKKARAAHLRSELRAFRTADVETRLEVERGITAAALDEEIRRLESQMPTEAKSAGGTVNDAMAAMERAAAVEAMVVGSSKVGSPATESPATEAPSTTLAGLATRVDGADGGNR